MCNWVTMLYSRKLTEHCKPAIMKKKKKKEKRKISRMHCYVKKTNKKLQNNTEIPLLKTDQPSNTG